MPLDKKLETTTRSGKPATIVEENVKSGKWDDEGMAVVIQEESNKRLIFCNSHGYVYTNDYFTPSKQINEYDIINPEKCDYVVSIKKVEKTLLFETEQEAKNFIDRFIAAGEYIFEIHHVPNKIKEKELENAIKNTK